MAVAERFEPGYEVFGLASGNAFPDALTGGAHASRRDMPLLLTGSEMVSESVVESVRRAGSLAGFIYGGTAAVSESVRLQLGPVNATIECGPFTDECTVTVSRVTTQLMCDEVCRFSTAAVISSAVIGIACAPLGALAGAPAGPVGVVAGGTVALAVCVAAFTIHTDQVFRDIIQAAAEGECLRFRFQNLLPDISVAANPTTIVDGRECDIASLELPLR